MAERPLAGCGVVVTRAAHQAGELCRALEDAGATALRYPTLAIEPLAPSLPTGRFDWIVYTSSNAVDHAGALRTRAGRVAAIGPATAAALAQNGIAVELTASGAGSESLLAALTPRLGKGQRALLVTGREGRELLPRALEAAGVAVQRAEVYRRVRPLAGAGPLLDAWHRGALHAATATSNAALANLHAMLDASSHPKGGGPQARALLDGLQLVVASERAVRLARELGIARAPLVAGDASAAALVATLAAWWPTAIGKDHGR
jgi:uroporphyrinogen-III synthase